MFSAAEMQLIREKPDCLSKFEDLLKNLSISIPDWNTKDELRIYEKIDDELTKKICGLMKSTTVIEGYMNLLKLGGIPYDYSESLKQLLNMVVTNGDKIFRGLERMSTTVTEPLPQPKQAQPPQQPKTKMRKVVHKEQVTLIGPIILGVAVFVIALIVWFKLDSKIGASILSFLGVVSAVLGIRGKTIVTTTTEPVVEKKSSTPQPVVQPTRQTIQQNLPFTRKELQNTLEVLAQVNNIVRAL